MSIALSDPWRGKLDELLSAEGSSTLVILIRIQIATLHTLENSIHIVEYV